MDSYTATEQAYKKGYEDGKRDTEPIHCERCKYHETIDYPEGQVWCNHLVKYSKKDWYCADGVKE